MIKGNFICRNAKLKSDYQYLDNNHDKQLALIANSAIVKGMRNLQNPLKRVELVAEQPKKKK